MGHLRVSFPEPCSENWDDMAPSGCNRHCASCDKIIHDLSNYTFEEAETLVSSTDQLCVRAKLNPDGSIALKPASGGVRRKIVAVGVTAGLLSLSLPLAAKDRAETGAIEGKLDYMDGRIKVIATDKNGRKFTAKVDMDGHFTIRNVPIGIYKMRFTVKCFSPGIGYRWFGKDVTVNARTTTFVQGDYDAYAEYVINGGGCPIYLGMIKVDTNAG